LQIIIDFFCINPKTPYYESFVINALAPSFSSRQDGNGLPVMMETPESKHTAYFIVSILVMIAATFVLSAIITPILV
jgi:hypothetical protein